MEIQKPFWSFPKDDLLKHLASQISGLTELQAQQLLIWQRKDLRTKSSLYQDFILLLTQFKSPLILILVFAVILSLVLGEYSDSIIILLVLLTTGILGFVQERNAGRAVQKLQELVHTKAMVRRDGIEKEILLGEVVAGDIIILNAGDIIPADALILEANDLHINESVLTGESFPVEKAEGACSEESISKVTNAVFKGTSVINGTAVVVAYHTDANSELGKIATSLEQTTTITAFEKGITSFGYILMRLTIIFTCVILILNIFFDRPFVESLLFSLALAVGLTPELLPAILTITLAAGAKRMAAKKVIVKKLSAIQNLGAINILCCDKTGTITEGVVKLEKAVDVDGKENHKLLLYAYLNASCETGFTNPIDESIRQLQNIDTNGYSKVDEVPYDFSRKRLSVVVAIGDKHIMITKGAFDNIVEVSSSVENSLGNLVNIESAKASVQKQFAEFSSQGSRVIALSYKDVTGDPVINKDDEKEMTFLGVLVLADPLKEGIIDSIQHLASKGIALKIVTGDNHHVATYLASQINLRTAEVLKGSDLHNLTSDALTRRIEQVDVFAEILPAQKERVIKAFKDAGNIVGYMGDGINDANALKAADVGISVNTAVDVAKEAADIVLLDKNIDVLNGGVLEGRRTFSNTMKYVFVTTSANFGNMFSMAVASLMLPFLPLLPVQILLNNFLSDVPAITIASDNVDDELIATPRKWNIAYIWRFMLVFGLQSSIFDFATFGLLYYLFHASPQEFRTAWFMESLLTEILILLIIRTRKPFFKSKPSSLLLWSAVFTFLACICVPYLSFASIFQLYPLPFNLFAGIMLITIIYVLLSEVTKQYVMKKFK